LTKKHSLGISPLGRERGKRERGREGGRERGEGER
jgi:hypothetical protein